jgi:SNF2 family DNA or RNA helicase
VCPSSLVNNWVKEFDHWLGKQGQPKRVPLLRGDTTFNSSSMKSFLHSKVGQVVIMSFELFRLHSHHFASPSSTQQQCGTAGAGQDRFALLVVDEGHRLKSTTGSLTLTSLEQLPADARLLLSATPIQNNLGELYTLANFCRPGILGESIAEFRRRFEKPIAASDTNQAAQRELEQILSTFMLRRLQTDVLKSMLPPRMEALIFCRPSQRQCDLYRQVVGAATSSSTSVDVLSALTSLRKVCSHPFLHDCTTEAEKLDSVGSSDVELSGKLVVLQGLLRSMRNQSVDGSSSSPPSADKVVIVSNFTSTLSLVESLLLKPSGYSYLRLDGSTSPETRQSLVDAFNKQSKIFCFLLSSKAGGWYVCVGLERHNIIWLQLMMKVSHSIGHPFS